MNGKLTTSIASIMAAVVFSLAGGTAQAAPVTVYENGFVDLVATSTLAGSAQAGIGLDPVDVNRRVLSRTPGSSGNAFVRMPASSDLGFDVTGKDFTISQVARFTGASGSFAVAPSISLSRDPAGAVVGNLARVTIFQRLNGTFQLDVLRYTSAGGATESIVSEAVAYNFGTTYRTLDITRTNAGVWSVSDNGTPFISGVVETAGTTGSDLNYLDVNHQSGGTAFEGNVQIYVDNLKLTSTVIPEPASLALLGTGLLLVLRRRSRR